MKEAMQTAGGAERERKSQRDLTQGSVPVSLLRLTAPMTVGITSAILVQTLEMGFIGQLSIEHVAAMTFTFPLTMVLSSVALGIGIGASSIIARGVGSGDWEDVRRLGTHSMLLSGGVMVLLAAVAWATVEPVFLALGAPASMLPLIRSYLDIFFPGAVLFTITMTASSIMRSSGNANIPGLIMTAGSALNLAIDPILIFGWFGFPRLELAGAAWAMTVTRLLTALVLFYYIYRSGLIRTTAITERFFESCRRILHIGIPAIATQLIGPVSAAVITRLLAGHGEIVVAGFGVASRIEIAAIITLFALSGSIGPFVGQNWGANRLDRVRGGVNASYVFCLGWGLLTGAALFLFRGNIAPWINDNPEVIAVAVFYLALVPWSHGLWGVLMMVSASFNALGKPIPSTLLSFTRMFVLNVPLALFFNAFWGYPGIFIATAASNCIMGIAGYLWFRQAYFGGRQSARA